MQVLTVGDSRLVLVRDDITRQDTDADEMKDWLKKYAKKQGS